MKGLSLFFMLSITSASFAQVNDRLYLDRYWRLCKKDSALYYRESQFDTVHYSYIGNVRDYTLSGQLIMFGFYVGKLRQNEFTFYFPNGKIESQGNFINDRRTGTWKYFYSNGVRKAEVEFFSSGHRILFYGDSTGRTLLENGTGKWQERYIYADAMPPLILINEGSYKKGKKDGKWICRTEDGKKIYEESYKDGEFFGGYNFKANGERNETINQPFKNHMNLPLELERPEQLIFAPDVTQADYPFLKKLPPAPGTAPSVETSSVEATHASDEIYTVIEVSASPKGGMACFYRAVSELQRYPKEARRGGIEGRVFVEFVVNKDGSLSDFKVIKGVGAGLDEEAIRCVMESTKTCPWNPGMQRGKPVKQRYALPIIFKLG